VRISIRVRMGRAGGTRSVPATELGSGRRTGTTWRFRDDATPTEMDRQVMGESSFAARKWPSAAPTAPERMIPMEWLT
jgi:hypothetical protein